MTDNYMQTLLYLERRAHTETRRKLQKAEHDRDRYAKRIRFVQARHEILSREFNAIRQERDILDSCVTILERRLNDEQNYGSERTRGARD